MSIHTLPVHLPFETLQALGEFTGKWWSDTYNLEPFVCQAIDSFVKQAPAAKQAPQAPQAPSEAGYQWKQVFLPEGTRLRASFGKQPYYAMVEGAEIKYGERAVSPSCFANLQGSGNRNAWKAIWLRLPGSDEWLLADVCRSARKAAIARLLGGTVQAGHPSQENERQPHRRPTGGRSVDDVRVESPRRPAAVQANSPPAGPVSNTPAPASGNVQRRPGRRSRRKRRAAKHLPGNP